MSDEHHFNYLNKNFEVISQLIDKIFFYIQKCLSFSISREMLFIVIWEINSCEMVLLWFSLDSVIPMASNLTSVKVRRLWSSVKWCGSKEILRWKKIKLFPCFFAYWFSSFEVTYLDKFSNTSVSALIWLKNFVPRDIFFLVAWVILMFLPLEVWIKSFLLKLHEGKKSLLYIMQNHFDFLSFGSN